MDDFSAQLKRVLRVCYFVLSFSFLGWAIFPELRGFVLGFVVGGLASMLNGYYLSMKIRQITQLVVEGGTRRMNIGFMTRAAIAVLAVMLALKKEGIDVYGVAAGLFLVPVVSLLVGFITSNKETK